MTFFREAEMEMLQAQCWSALGDWPRAARHARRATRFQDPHFTRNLALYRAQLTGDLARAGIADEAAAAGHAVLDLLDQVQSSRIRAMLASAVRVLRAQSGSPAVTDFVSRYAEAGAAVTGPSARPPAAR